MQDQVQSIVIEAIYLGSAQLDKHAESRALEISSNTNVIFVTPEWMTNTINQAKLQALAKTNQLQLIAIDEAHLCTEWSDFRIAFTDLRNIKHNFPDTPIMALTATANSFIEDDIKLLLRPIVHKASMNRPNVYLNVEELPTDRAILPALQFASRAAEI